MVPLEILVAMESAWKKEVFSGPRPVLPGGTNTSMGAKAPAFAGAATWCGVHIHVCVCVSVCVCGRGGGGGGGGESGWGGGVGGGFTKLF